MRFRIHRAAAEIGGNCVEVESQGYSILLDLGLPLTEPVDPVSLLPDVPGLKGMRDPRLLGVVLSHPHQDHYGLLSQAPTDLPVYLGGDAIRMLRAADIFTRSSSIPQSLTPYSSNVPFQLGPFRITPHLVDHSAFDAHALLIEADGSRLFYSGDFRMHGRKTRNMEALLESPPERVDVLLMEGTNLGRRSRSIAVETEDDLERRIAKRLGTCDGLVLAYAAGQNIDRLVTFYRAALRSGRGLVLDAYAAHVLAALGRSSLPSIDAPRVRVFLPAAQRRRIVQGGHFDVVSAFRHKRIYAEELARDGKRWIMLFRDSMRRDIEALAPSRATLI
jgi:ribonuclease J